MNIDKERLLNVEQVRRILQCSRSYVYSLIELGELQSLRLGGRHGIRIKQSALEQFLQNREQGVDI